eukprot:CAMPEP_0114352624 /NCGR_PEP_ID=MMETSP0101-20121206/18081_1 /TAXON_ID=38822 ORGANISM="Pteridomonas danica, Strain PT" /NCGR_SAMPLE_ID=MMETSP0101 /ASSEMBLY_ACC=CAM_ASM_000211 /LENGTH=249 /DNA_ID=CAMNT_0001493109 /DNA_START=13 /DNA_END=759 /DNA_ORIENTATION=+
MLLPVLPTQHNTPAGSDDGGGSGGGIVYDGGDGNNFQLSIPPPISNAFKQIIQNEKVHNEEIIEDDLNHKTKKMNNVFSHQMSIILRYKELLEMKELIEKDTILLNRLWQRVYFDNEDPHQYDQPTCIDNNHQNNSDDDEDIREFERIRHAMSMLQQCSTLALRRRNFIHAVTCWNEDKHQCFDSYLNHPDQSSHCLKGVDVNDLSFINDVKTEDRIKFHILQLIESKQKKKKTKNLDLDQVPKTSPSK